MFKKIVFNSNKSGLNILILGAIHGNEVAGTIAQNEIIQEIIDKKITLKTGQITFIPTVNQKAQDQDTRFIDENLNRIIKFHQNPTKNEEKIANQLITEIENADIMLDLHSTHNKEDAPFAFIDYPTTENLDFLNIIPVNSALAGWPKIYKDQPEIENFCTEEYAYHHQTKALTVECGYHKSTESVKIAKQSILNTLLFYDIIEGEKPLIYKKNIITIDSFIIKEEDGNFTKEFKHLDKISKGEVIATYKSGKNLYAPFNGVIIMPNKNAFIKTEWFYIGKENL